MNKTYLRNLGAPLSAAELDAVNEVLRRRGLRTYAVNARLLDVLMAVSECDADTFVRLAGEVRAAIERVGEAADGE